MARKLIIIQHVKNCLAVQMFAYLKNTTGCFSYLYFLHYAQWGLACHLTGKKFSARLMVMMVWDKI